SCRLYLPICVLPIRLAPTSTLFPYTTLFRSRACGCIRCSRVRSPAGRGVGGSPPPDRCRLRGRGFRRPAMPTALGSYGPGRRARSEEHTSELQSRFDLVCRLLLEKKKKKRTD